MLNKKILKITITIIFYLNSFLLQPSNKSKHSILKAYLFENYDILTRPMPPSSSSLGLPSSLSISLTLHQILSMVKVFVFYFWNFLSIYIHFYLIYLIRMMFMN